MSKANLKNYRWETVDDVDFFTNGVVCTDINMKDTVKQLCFQHMAIDIDRGNKKVFPNVEEIYIGPEVAIIIMARKTAANPDAYYLDLRGRLSVGCKRRSYFFFLYLPVFSYLRLWYSVH